ncbi:TPA: hypothetical protein ACHXPB_003624, partial [Shigella flexneri]
KNDSLRTLRWHTEFGYLNRGDMFTSEQHRYSNEKKEFQRRVYLRGDAFINLYTNFYSCIMTGLQLLRHFQRIALPAYHPTFFIP